MYIDGKFIFDTQLISKLEQLIRSSKSYLYIISPFIDLDERIKDALLEKKKDPEFKLYVLFGKNEDNIYKSVKNDSFDFFKEFINVEIRHNKRLHAKFYLNDNFFIMTSLNLYDYSLANNIEVGILVHHTPTNVIKKIDNSISDLVDKGAKNITSYFRENIDKDEVEPISKFKLIFENSELLYKSESKFIETKSLVGLITNKKYDGKNIVLDKLNVTSQRKIAKINSSIVIEESNKIIKYYSATKYCEKINIDKTKFESLVKYKGFINNSGEITELGRQRGLIIKTYMGKEYIAYPDNLNLEN